MEYMPVDWIDNPIPDAFTVNGFPLIEFDRPVDRYTLRGFALGWNRQLTIVHVLETQTYRLDGYAIFRNPDVKRWREIPKEDFVARAARLHRLRPSRPDALDIASLQTASATAGAAFPLITIHREHIKKRVCRVGRMLRTSRRALTIFSISTQAEWEGEESFLLRDITLLEFGGTYERLLARMAPKLPPVSRE